MWDEVTHIKRLFANGRCSLDSVEEPAQPEARDGPVAGRRP